MSQVNQICNLYRDEFGKLNRQGLRLESIQRNLYRPDADHELKIVKMKNLKFKRDKERWRAYDRNGRPVTLPECKRKSYHDLTGDEFRREYLERNQPVIISDAFDHWEALKRWNKKYILDRFGDQELGFQENGSIKILSVNMIFKSINYREILFF